MAVGAWAREAGWLAASLFRGRRSAGVSWGCCDTEPHPGAYSCRCCCLTVCRPGSLKVGSQQGESLPGTPSSCRLLHEVLSPVLVRTADVGLGPHLGNAEAPLWGPHRSADTRFPGRGSGVDSCLGDPSWTTWRACRLEWAGEGRPGHGAAELTLGVEGQGMVLGTWRGLPEAWESAAGAGQGRQEVATRRGWPGLRAG